MEVTQIPDILHALIYQWDRVEFMERKTAGHNACKIKQPGVNVHFSLRK